MLPSSILDRWSRHSLCVVPCVMSDALLTLPCDILYHADVVWCDCVNVVCYSVLYGDGTVVSSCMNVLMTYDILSLS